VLVEEARALQVALFQAIQNNLDRIGIGQLAGNLMAIADEVNAQLLQSLSSYENEKPVAFPQDDRVAQKRETVEREISQGPGIEVKVGSRQCSFFETTQDIKVLSVTDTSLAYARTN
jgi:hypothetical protein